jgi:hypothetical protein
MWKIEKEFSVKLGGNTYINTPNLIVYKGEPLFKLYRSDSDGMLGIDFDLFDKSGKRIATIRKGIVVQGDTKSHKIESSHEEYKVIEKDTQKVIAAVKRRGTEGAELEVTVCLHTSDGFLIDATPTKTNIGGMTMTGCVMKDCAAGIAIK